MNHIEERERERQRDAFSAWNQCKKSIIHVVEKLMMMMLDEGGGRHLSLTIKRVAMIHDELLSPR
jgi:hypothetical protein